MAKKIIIGIQGGKGSFNEEALVGHVNNFQIKYLYNTKNVFRALKNRKIDYGQFAVSNNQSGIVMESIEQISKNNFQIIKTYTLAISQNLLIRKDVSKNDITQIMAHPQSFMQCRHTLARKYPNLRQIIGKGKLVDPAYIAQQLVAGKLPKTTAILGSARLADIYDLHIVAKNLQDDSNNITTFLLIKLKHK